MNDTTELNTIIENFTEELVTLHEHTEGIVDTEDFTNILVRYHIQVLNHLIEHKEQLCLVLRDWSAGYIDNETGEKAVKIFTKEDNGKAFGLLWGIGIEEEVKKSFGKRLSEIETYDKGYLPLTLKNHYPNYYRRKIS